MRGWSQLYVFMTTYWLSAGQSVQTGLTTDEQSGVFPKLGLKSSHEKSPKSIAGHRTWHNAAGAMLRGGSSGARQGTRGPSN